VKATAIKVLRILLALMLATCFLLAASWAVQDCRVGAYTFDNCRWLWLRERFVLPANKLVRSMTMEWMGLILSAGIYLTFRYIFPPLRAPGSPRRKPEPTD